MGIAFLYSKTLKIDKLSTLYWDFFVDSGFLNDQHKLTSRRDRVRFNQLIFKGNFDANVCNWRLHHSKRDCFNTRHICRDSSFLAVYEQAH